MASTLTMIAPSGTASNRSWANMGGDQPRFGPLNGRLTTQAPIMTNVGINKGMHEWRAKSANDFKIPSNRVFSRLLTTGRGDAYDLLHVKALDGILAYKKQLQTRDIDPYNENRAHGIATLNGLNIESRFENNDAAFHDQFTFLGYSMRDWLFGRADQPETGVAVMVHGSKNFFYRGYKNKPLYPGDRMMWSLPSTNPQIREQQEAQLAGDADHPVERQAIIIEPLHYGQAHYFVQYEISMSFADRNFNRYLYHRIRPGASEAVSRDQLAAIAFRSLLQFAAFSTLAVFQLYTGIDLPTPNNNGAEGSALNDNDFNRNHPVERTVFKNLIQVGSPIVVNNNGELSMSADVVLTPELQEKRSNQLEFWAAKLGCAPTAKPVAGDHAENMTNAILAMTLSSLLGDSGLSKGVEVQKLFSPQRRLQAKRPSRRADERALSPEWNETSVVGCLGYLQNSVATDVFHCVGDAIERVQDRCIGTCLSYTVPGDWGDEYH